MQDANQLQGGRYTINPQTQERELVEQTQQTSEPLAQQATAQVADAKAKAKPSKKSDQEGQ